MFVVPEQDGMGPVAATGSHGRAAAWHDVRFAGALVATVAVAAVIRLSYVLTDHRPFVGGDGFEFMLEAHRFADGFPYTSGLGYVGTPLAHHPPGWVTVLGIVWWFGGRTLHAQQLVGVIIGLGVVVLAGLVGRQYFDRRVGMWAAVIAAIYPGFWVIEAQILSEPLCLLLLGIFFLECAALSKRQTVQLSVLLGATCGLVALVRSEQILLLLIVVVPLLYRARSLTFGQRTVRVAAASVAAVVIILPWALYNTTRFDEPVVLSTNDGATLLAGNCPPSTYRGEGIGSYDITCNRRLGVTTRRRGGDRSVQDRLARDQALSNIRHNLGKLPLTVAARFGRLFAVFQPAQTVSFAASWFRSEEWPVWLWVVSFWVLTAFAAMGTVIARRRHALLLPLLGPVIVMLLIVLVTYGEPRYHTPADLGLVVLAAVAVDRLFASVFKGSRATPAVPPEETAHVPVGVTGV
jgi:4-amino-4-deoxy-L-arabinose transferase-like glycosyltransferase